jgi:hypothetical protein
MRPLFHSNIMISLGLLLLSASFLLKHFFAIPDFFDGFLKGISIGVILISVILKWYAKQNEN